MIDLYVHAKNVVPVYIYCTVAYKHIIFYSLSLSLYLGKLLSSTQDFETNSNQMKNKLKMGYYKVMKLTKWHLHKPAAMYI